MADVQTAGRGRLGRTWESGPPAGSGAGVPGPRRSGSDEGLSGSVPVGSEGGGSGPAPGGSAGGGWGSPVGPARGSGWGSPAGAARASGPNLLCSILLRPPVLAEGSPPFLAVARVSLAGRAAASHLATGQVVGLKWPNDLVVGADGLGGKLAGVLAEVERDAVVVGIGMNLSWAPPGAAYLGEGIHRDAVLDALLRSLDDWLVADDRMVLRAYREACVTLGRPVRIDLGGDGSDGGDGDESFTGVAADITDTGALLVETDVCIREVSAGDVIHLR